LIIAKELINYNYKNTDQRPKMLLVVSTDNEE